MNKQVLKLVFFIATTFTLVQCSSNSGNEISNADYRAKLISQLMDSDNYMREVMEAMRIRHGEEIVSTSSDMMRSDKAVGTRMIGKMVDMCKTDTAMCKMMMAKTMEMCDMDKEKCKMMMTSMQEHPKGMQNMKDLGMCNMEMNKMK